ncbi:MAG: transglutaminase-like cysteine peptidase [Desulfovibrio sp.]|jgi:predicted transglutaminase-like cysteine proteinase|nr:transglutaminase-like cysteine peptidase [Desulfovibrio sp.]
MGERPLREAIPTRKPADMRQTSPNPPRHFAIVLVCSLALAWWQGDACGQARKHEPAAIPVQVSDTRPSMGAPAGKDEDAHPDSPSGTETPADGILREPMPRCPLPPGRADPPREPAGDAPTIKDARPLRSDGDVPEPPPDSVPHGEGTPPEGVPRAVPVDGPVTPPADVRTPPRDGTHADADGPADEAAGDVATDAHSSGDATAGPHSGDAASPTPGETPSDADANGASSPPSKKVAQPKTPIFGTMEFRRPLASLPGWLDVLERNKADPIFQPDRRLGKSVTWGALKRRIAGRPVMELLRQVNSFWNAWPYKEDMANWGEEDRWETPAEFLARSGDCEDYAIVKYFTLKELGVPAEDMRIVVLRDTLRNVAHAVLVVYVGDEAYVLDNLGNVVLPSSRFPHYTPQYSVNEQGRWAHVKGRRLNRGSR